MDVALGLFGGLCLFGGDAAECDKGGDVDGPCIVHDRTNNLLYAFDSFRWQWRGHVMVDRFL